MSANRYLPFVLYVVGSLCFLAGSVLSVWQMWRGR